MKRIPWGGFVANDLVICPSGKRARIIKRRSDGRLEALYLNEYPHLAQVILAPEWIRHEDDEWIATGPR